MDASSAPPADRANLSLWQNYTEVNDYLQLVTDKTLKQQAGIRLVDFKVLQILIESPEAQTSQMVRMGHLSQMLKLSPSRLTYQINSLAKSGWVEKVSVDSDRRGAGVSITDAGREIFETARSIHKATLHDLVCGNLSKSEVEFLGAIYSRLFNSIDTHYRERSYN